jgi:hypothetical protein
MGTQGSCRSVRLPKAEGETIALKKTFKDYGPGFIHHALGHH